MSDASRPEPTRPPVEGDERDADAGLQAAEDAADSDEQMTDEDYAALMEEPTAGELGILADTDVPGAPG
jgi:4-aminobutyrate aminotransferase-like enzyme